MSEQPAIVGAHAFLRGMPRSQVAQLAALARHVSLPAQHRMFEEGMAAHSFWLIDAGQVAVDVLVPGRGRITIDMLGRGDLLGLSWMVPPYLWEYGAITTQPMQAFEFDAAAVRAACAQDPALGYEFMVRMMAVAARRLQATRARLISLSTAEAADTAPLHSNTG